MARILYELFIVLYPFVIKIVSPFNEKARLWLKGRKDVFGQMELRIKSNTPLIWMHCSSLGEFEQGRPLLEKLRVEYSSYKVLLTFFSPSGYEVRKNYNGADYIFYLPMDSKENAQRFFEIAKPNLILFIKYEFWYYYLKEAKNRNIPLLLISAIFRKNQPFFKGYGHFHREMLSCFTHLFLQNQQSLLLLQTIGLKNFSIAGDTRFDRVIEIAEKFEPVIPVDAFCAGATVVVAGSTWSEDDKELAHYANSRINVKFIIAPHNIGKDRLNECLRLYKNSVLFSAITNLPPSKNINTIIIDNIGMLSRLYKYGTITYVGGGFGEDGVHNVLEAAVFGKPVVFGPEYDKFFEAVELVSNGGGISVETALELEAELDKLLKKDEAYIESCKASLNYVYSKKGSTEKILQFIQEKRLLTR